MINETLGHYQVLDKLGEGRVLRDAARSYLAGLVRPESSSKAQGAKSGPARSGRGVGTSVGRRRWRKMRSIPEAPSTSAINRSVSEID